MNASCTVQERMYPKFKWPLVCVSTHQLLKIGAPHSPCALCLSPNPHESTLAGSVLIMLPVSPHLLCARIPVQTYILSVPPSCSLGYPPCNSSAVFSRLLFLAQFSSVASQAVWRYGFCGQFHKAFILAVKFNISEEVYTPGVLL